MHVHCKICGIRDVGSARLAAQLGSDLIGLHAIWQIKPKDLPVFRQIVQEVPRINPTISIVLVTRQEDIRAIMEMVGQITPAYIQLHAPWSQGRIAALREDLQTHGHSTVQLIGVVGLEDGKALRLVKTTAQAVELLLLDSSFRGGTGRSAHLQLLKRAKALAGSTPVLIAGGLTPENVAFYVRALRPFGVDVQTGVEYPERPGTKDPTRMAAFIRAAKGESLPELTSHNASGQS